MFQFDSPQVKRNLISVIKNFRYVLPHKIQSNLRLGSFPRHARRRGGLSTHTRKKTWALGNQKILERLLTWVYSTGTNSQNWAKTDIKVLCSNLLDFFTPSQKLYPEIQLQKALNPTSKRSKQKENDVTNNFKFTSTSKSYYCYNQHCHYIHIAWTWYYSITN